MKKIVVLTAAILCAATLTGCGGNTANQATADKLRSSVNTFENSISKVSVTAQHELATQDYYGYAAKLQSLQSKNEQILELNNEANALRSELVSHINAAQAFVNKLKQKNISLTTDEHKNIASYRQAISRATSAIKKRAGALKDAKQDYKNAKLTQADAALVRSDCLIAELQNLNSELSLALDGFNGILQTAQTAQPAASRKNSNTQRITRNKAARAAYTNYIKPIGV